jgi:hypothetical protein
MAMRTLHDSLLALETTLVELDLRVVQLLQPGLSQEAVEGELTLRRLTASEEYVTLYGWRNGTDATTSAVLGDLWVVPGFYVLSIEDALSNYDTFIADDRWDPAWLPILANGGGDFLAAQLPSNNAIGGYVRHFRIEDDEHPVEYHSISDMFATFVAAYERDVFFVDGDGNLDMDDGAYSLLASGMNPDVGWWTTG